MIIKKIIKHLLIYIFSSFLVSLKTFSRNFNEDILRLVFTFVAFAAVVGSVATSGSIAGSFPISGSLFGSDVGSRVGILSIFFIGNNLLLKILKTFFLALNNNPKLFKKDFFHMFLYLFQNSLIH